jgi:hypothetical protein
MALPLLNSSYIQMELICPGTGTVKTGSESFLTSLSLTQPFLGAHSVVCRAPSSTLATQPARTGKVELSWKHALLNHANFILLCLRLPHSKTAWNFPGPNSKVAWFKSNRFHRKSNETGVVLDNASRVEQRRNRYCIFIWKLGHQQKDNKPLVFCSLLSPTPGIRPAA